MATGGAPKLVASCAGLCEAGEDCLFAEDLLERASRRAIEDCAGFGSDGLAVEHTGLAAEVSKRFRLLCETSGFAENFDAATGAGQRDRAYTWTASSYLILAKAAARGDSPHRQAD